MKLIPGMGLLFLLALAPTALATEVHTERDAQVDAVTVEADLSAYAADQGAPSTSSDEPLLNIELGLIAEALPSDSAAAPELQTAADTVDTSLPSEDAPQVAADQPNVPDPGAELEAVMSEGVGTESQTTASDQGVETSVSTHVGDHGASAGETAPVDTPPILALSSYSSSRPAGAAPDESQAPTETQDAAPGAAPHRDAQAIGVLDAAVVAPAPGLGMPSAIAASVAFTTAATGAAFYFVPGWRQVAWRVGRKLFGFFLFSRIAQEDILNHLRRNELIEFIKLNPGERVETARRTLGISNGSMHYHLKVLQDRGLVKVLKDRGYARLYMAGPKVQPQPYVPPQRRRFVELLGTSPGLSQRELAGQLGVSERMVSYHVNALVSQGIVEIRLEGARKRLFPRGILVNN